MNKFLFKSSDPDLQKMLINKVDALLNEQRCQRYDLKILNGLIQKLINSANLQKQVDEYFEDDAKDIPEVEDGNSTN